MMSRRWIERDGEFGVASAVDAFLDDVLAACRKHGMSIGHEDSGGGFLVHAYSDELAAWLRDAADARRSEMKSTD